MSPPEFDDDVTVDVDEALLAEIRAKAARRDSRHDETSTPPSPGSGPERPEEDTVTSRGVLGTQDLYADIPSIDGYGALREIGRGGFSRVYEALQFEFERWVAVKVLDEALDGDDETAEFERECRLMGVLSRHPNIVTVFASAFTDEHRPSIVMELFPHGSYLNIMQRTGLLGMQELLSLSIRVCGALASAHRQGMVHGDVKPQNMFRSEFGTPALGDFGIATLTSHGLSADKTRLSPYYAAPELIERGVSATSPFADQYSLGATIYTLATGRRPYETDDNETTRQLLTRALSEPPPRLGSQSPPALADALHQAMAREPHERHRDVIALAAALAQLEQELGFPVTEVPFSRDRGRYVGQTPDAASPRFRQSTSSRDLSQSRDLPTADMPASTGRSHHGEPPSDGSLEMVEERRTVVRPAAPEPETPPSEPAEPLLLDRFKAMPAWAWIALAAGLVTVVVVAVMALSGGGSDDEPGIGISILVEPTPKADAAAEVDAPAENVQEADGDSGSLIAAPGSLEVASQRNALEVRWTAPPNGDIPIIHYRVEWRSLDGTAPEVGESLIDPANLDTVISGLASDRAYLVRVAARNENGLGAWAEAEGITLSEGVPDPPTLDVAASGGGIAIDWDAPWDAGEPLTAYLLEWEGADGQVNGRRYNAATLSAEIPDRAAGETYTVRIAAENANGLSAWTEQVFSAPDMPGAPEALQVAEHDRRLIFSWDEPLDGESPITSYILELHDSNNLIDRIAVPADARSAEISGLINGRTYGVRVIAENQAGEGQPVVGEATPQAPPSVIAFASDRDGSRDVYFANVDNGEITRVTQTDRQETPEDWSPDRAWAVIAVRSSGQDWEIAALNMNTGEERWLTCNSINDWGSSWSTDGTRIAFTRGRTGAHDIWMLDLRNGEERTTGRRPQRRHAP